LEWSLVTKDLLDEFSHAKGIFVEKDLTTDMISTIVDKIDADHDTFDVDPKVKKILNYAIIELGQNMIKHGVNAPEEVQPPSSKIELRVWANELYLETENYLEVNEIAEHDAQNPAQEFTKKIKDVWNMWYDELQIAYRNAQNPDEQSHYFLSSEEWRKKWAGLGFIDVARKIKKMYNHIWQIFIPILEKVNDSIYRFKLITKIPLVMQ